MASASPSVSPSLSPSRSPSLSPSRSPSLSASVSPSPSAATAEASMREEYGYRITGDTGLVTVTDTYIYVKSFIFTNADNANTATITDYAGNAVMIIVPDTTIDGVQTQIEWGQRIKGLKVQLSSASSILIVNIE